MLVVLMASGMRASSNVVSGTESTSYAIIIPFWSIGGTSSQITNNSTEVIASTLTLLGALVGAA